MTGKACISVTKHYDRKTQRIGLEKRPVLIIGNTGFIRKLPKGGLRSMNLPLGFALDFMPRHYQYR